MKCGQWYSIARLAPSQYIGRTYVDGNIIKMNVRTFPRNFLQGLRSSFSYNNYFAVELLLPVNITPFAIVNKLVHFEKSTKIIHFFAF